MNLTKLPTRFWGSSCVLTGSCKLDEGNSAKLTFRLIRLRRGSSESESFCLFLCWKSTLLVLRDVVEGLELVAWGLIVGLGFKIIPLGFPPILFPVPKSSTDAAGLTLSSSVIMFYKRYVPNSCIAVSVDKHTLQSRRYLNHSHYGKQA